jgi:hypothetical protein
MVCIAVSTGVIMAARSRGGRAAKPQPAARIPKRPNLDELVPATLGRLSDELLASGIHVEITDDPPAHFRITAGGAIDSGGPEGTAIRIRGPAQRIAALLGGRKHPAAVFVDGGIQIAGDVGQITALSEELPALTMERRSAAGRP